MKGNYSPYNRSYKFICLQNQLAHIKNKSSAKSIGKPNISLYNSPEKIVSRSVSKKESYQSTRPISAARATETSLASDSAMPSTLLSTPTWPFISTKPTKNREIGPTTRRMRDWPLDSATSPAMWSPTKKPKKTTGSIFSS